MRQTVSLLLAGMLLLAACSASGAGTIETAAVYEAPVYRFSDLTAQESFQSEEGVQLAYYDYKLFTLTVDNLDSLSPEDQTAAERNLESFNDRARKVLEEAVDYGRELPEIAEALDGPALSSTVLCDETTAQGYMGGEIISVRTDTWGYTGGAHGYSYTTGYTFDLSTGQVIDPVQLADDPAVFQEAAGDALIAAADSLSREQRDLYWDNYRDIIREWNNGAVYFSQVGMTVIFSAYELGPYVLGPVELTLGWEALAELMGPGGVERLGMAPAAEN